MSITRHQAACPLDCPDGCSLDVSIENGRVVAIDGNRVNPLTNGFICGKVRRFPRRMYGPDRLLHPMKRTGPKGEREFTRISWDEALGTITEKFSSIRAEHGGEAILPFAYGGSNGMLSDGLMDERYFRALGASRLEKTICAVATAAAAEAIYHGMPCADQPDFAHARHIIVWGGNPKKSNIHLVPYLKEAKASGSRITLVDPRRILSDDLIDHHLAVHPGTDSVLALSMIHWIHAQGLADDAFLKAHTTGAGRLFDEASRYAPEEAASITGVPAEDIRRAAESYATADPAMIRCGWGLERNRNGEAAAAAVLALPAVAGKFGKRGGGYALSTSRGYRFDSESVVGIPDPDVRTINMNQLGTALIDATDPPVRALFVYNANPVATVPDQRRVVRGFERDDLFTVVFEQVMTDTAAYADILLPATTFLEHTELSKGYGTYNIMLTEACATPPGEARSNEKVFADLGRRARFDGALFGEDTRSLVDRALGAFGIPLNGEPTYDSLVKRGRLGVRPGDGSPVQFRDSAPETADGKATLWPRELGENPYRFVELRDEEHPLVLISPATEKTISSTLGEFNLNRVHLEIHPDDAAPRGVTDRSTVIVYNERGEVEIEAKVTDTIKPGVVSIPKGAWRKSTRNGWTANALAPDTVTPVSHNACFNDAMVEVRPAEAGR